MDNASRVSIEIELLNFKDGIGHIDQSIRAGHITEGIAHGLKNNLAAIYAERIVHLVHNERSKTND